MLRFHLAAVMLFGLSLAGCRPSPATREPGVPSTLARLRAAQVEHPRYDLALSIPTSPDEPVVGSISISFSLVESGQELLLDFSGPSESVRNVSVNGIAAEALVENEHIVIASDLLSEGENTVALDFRAGDNALNRRDEYLYSLFVPAHARTAFPCFDQPDLKGRFRLTMDVPSDWEAISNGSVESRQATGARAVVRFEETLPISSYLFAFAAGVFAQEVRQVGDRQMHMWHRETDREKVARNADSLFALHAESLAWLETYTGRDYPFPSFGFVLLPDFQFSGMEHPGAVFYNAASLLLDTSATKADELDRARLIAHETAHMWFGDLVTMRWFDDVWTKEVFANFMADKIVDPSFPEIDHDLAFYLNHFPAAYAVDRSAGTHPIHQELENLDEAGSLYGSIIYHKAPIVMRALEQMIGADQLRSGIQEYLSTFAFGNASWSELISLLDDRTEDDLDTWNRTWVETAGRPVIRVVSRLDADGYLSSLTLDQSGPDGRPAIWPQKLDLLLAYPGDHRRVTLFMETEQVAAPIEPGFPGPDFVIPGATGTGYGYFALDSHSLEALPTGLSSLEAPLERAVGWSTLWEQVLGQALDPVAAFESVLHVVESETNDLLLGRILADVDALYWRFLPAAARDSLSARLEEVLWDLVQHGASPSIQVTALRRLAAVATTDESVAALTDFWRGELRIEGIELGEEDMTRLVLELAVRDIDGREAVLDRQAERISNPERRDRLVFLRSATDPDPATRDSLYRTLLDPATRPQERWALDAARLVHHPLRAGTSLDLLRPGLNILPEIQRSGTIFFPERWVAALLSGHASPAAAESVREYLDAHPDIPRRLRGKVLQAADLLFRAAARSN